MTINKKTYEIKSDVSLEMDQIYSDFHVQKWPMQHFLA